MFYVTDEQIEALIDITATRGFMCTVVVLLVGMFIGVIAWCEYDLRKTREKA